MITRSDIQQSASSVEKASLAKLQHWLEYEKYTWVMAAGAVWFYFIVIRLLYLAAVIFTPFMIWHLYKAGWQKSIMVFLGVVLLPAVIFQFIPAANIFFDFLLTFVPLISFYFYTWILNYMIKDRLAEMGELKRINVNSTPDF